MQLSYMKIYNQYNRKEICMGYLSFDASIKSTQSGHFSSTKTKRVGFGGISGYIRHVDRETDKRNNCEVSHSNPETSIPP